MNEATSNYLHTAELAKTDPLLMSHAIGLFNGLTADEKEQVRLVQLRHKTWRWAIRILEAAKNDSSNTAKNSTDWQVRSALEDIQLHVGYAEPGYSDPECGIVATGNWNEITKWDGNERHIISDVPARIARLFEKLGIETEWSDEWCSCSHCDKIVRTEPDSYSWKPSYTVGDGELWCHECEEPKEETKTDD
jgi:hypothetical protein